MASQDGDAVKSSGLAEGRCHLVDDGTQDMELANVCRSRQQLGEFPHKLAVFKLPDKVWCRKDHCGIVAAGVRQYFTVLELGKQLRIVSLGLVNLLWPTF